jgi:hypothetical protein
MSQVYTDDPCANLMEPMPRFSPRCAAAFLLIAFPVPALADEVVFDDDGRQIQLNADGTWVFLSRDRFAINAAGDRIRLRPDGTWTTASSPNAPKKTTTTGASTDVDVSMYLAQVEIQRKMTRRQKNKHAEMRTIYTLRLANNSDRAIPLSESLAGRMTAGSSRGAEYPIESLVLPGASLGPGENADLHVIAVGAPQWFGVKYLGLDIAADTFGDSAKQALRKDMDEVIRLEVDEFRLPDGQ